MMDNSLYLRLVFLSLAILAVPIYAKDKKDGDGAQTKEKSITRRALIAGVAASGTGVASSQIAKEMPSVDFLWCVQLFSTVLRASRCT